MHHGPRSFRILNHTGPLWYPTKPLMAHAHRRSIPADGNSKNSTRCHMPVFFHSKPHSVLACARCCMPSEYATVATPAQAHETCTYSILYAFAKNLWRSRWTVPSSASQQSVQQDSSRDGNIEGIQNLNSSHVNSLVSIWYVLMIRKQHAKKSKRSYASDEMFFSVLHYAQQAHYARISCVFCSMRYSAYSSGFSEPSLLCLKAHNLLTWMEQGQPCFLFA